MMASDDSLFKAIMADDVSVLSRWSLDHCDFKVTIDGRDESVLTLACAANATNCVNSMLLRGLVPEAGAIAAAVRTGDTALIRKIEAAADPSTSLLPAYQTALYLEMESVAVFFARKQPDVTIWHSGLIKELPQDELRIACPMAARAVLETLPQILFVCQKEVCDSTSKVLELETLISKCLGSRGSETIVRIRAVCGPGKWTLQGAYTGDPWEAPGLWPEVRIVELSESAVSSIGESSFAKSSKLNRVVLPDIVTELGNYAFSCCHSLTTVKVGKGMRSLGNYVFYQCESLVEVVLPDIVTQIGVGAFCSCTSLNIVKVGNELETLGEKAFFNCGSLVEIVLPDTVREVGGEAFCNCFLLKSVKLGNGLWRLGNAAFYNCYGLIGIVLPDTIR
jgi:hypothetical protein